MTVERDNGARGMEMTNNRPLVIYHGNCADGFAAAWCFWRKYGDGADYVAGVYQQPPPDVTGRTVFLVDFSYKRAVVEKMFEQAACIVLIDHHKTAIDDLRPLFEQVQTDELAYGLDKRAVWFCDIEHSGAMLAWRYLSEELPPRLIQHVEDRDLWRFKLPGTREIQAALFSYPYDFEVWDTLMKYGDVDMQTLISAGAAIERKHHKDIAELLAVCKRRMTIGGIDVPVASLPYTLVSDAAHAMAKGEPFAACYWDTANGRIFGLRSTDAGIDVSDIAKQYGGGGHRNAAGFTVPRDHALATA